MKLRVFVVFFLWFATSATAQTASQEGQCLEYGNKISQQVAGWDYAQFEQLGWRNLAGKKCFFAAGSSIVAWLSAHQDDVTDAQSRTLRYHAARVFAMAGRADIALIHLQNAKNPNQQDDAEQDWNSYIDAFSAWLRRDLADLRASIQRLEQQKENTSGFKPNLIAAKRFLLCYARPYSSIETDPSCIEKKDDSAVPVEE